MRTSNTSARKMRGFDWRLAALERKLDWELDAARMRLANALAQWEVAGQSLRGAEALQHEAGEDARATVPVLADPYAHQHLLRYLVGLANQVVLAADKERTTADQLAAARQDVLQRQRHLDVLAQAREAALRAHLQAQGRSAQTEADATWLSLRELQRSGTSEEEKA